MNSQSRSSNDQAPAQDQSSNGKALMEFTPFPKLHPDLRVMVWKATLTHLLNRRSLSVNSNQPLSSIKIPSLLGVNAETRYEASNWYKNIAISAEQLHDLGLPGRFWVRQGEKLRILFNHEIDVIVDEDLRCDIHLLSNNNRMYANSPRLSPQLIDPDFVKKVQVSPNVFTNCSWIWQQTLGNWHYRYHGFEEIKLGLYARHRIMFTNFSGMLTDLRFNNLNKFIVQDFDCVLPHQLDSPEKRATREELLSIMFKAEKTRESKSHIQVSIPKIIIRPGAKVSLCDHCTVRFTPRSKWPLDLPQLLY